MMRADPCFSENRAGWFRLPSGIGWNDDDPSFIFIKVRGEIQPMKTKFLVSVIAAADHKSAPQRSQAGVILA